MKKQPQHPQWFRSRTYLHFDSPVGFKTAERLVKNPSHVATHPFYPFICYSLVTTKVKKDHSSGKLYRVAKPRPIAYAAHIDSHIYSYYCFALGELYEAALKKTGIEHCALAFRALGKSNIDFANQAFDDIKSMGACTVFAFDITGFFDNLDHELLKSAWANLLVTKRLPADHFAVYKSLTRAAKVDRDEVYKKFGISTLNPKNGRTRICNAEEFRAKVRDAGLINRNMEPRGIPQGSPISAMLSNIYMLDFDIKVSRAIDEIGGKYYRYCDDMLFIIPHDWRSWVGGFVRTEIRKLKIDINPDKTDVRDFTIDHGKLFSSKPLQYLGFLFDGQKKYIRSAAFARYSERMRKKVRVAKRSKLKYDVIRLGKGLPTKGLYKKKIYDLYSHLGKRNFIRYGLTAADTMDSKTIKTQMKTLWQQLQDEINKP